MKLPALQEQPAYNEAIRWLPVKSAVGEVAPGGALLRVTGAEDDGTLIVNKPNADNQQYLLICGPMGLDANGRGVATYDEFVPAAFEDGDGTPAVGEAWGSKSGEWLLRKTYAGYVISAADNGDGQVEVVRVVPENWFPAELTAVQSTSTTPGTGEVDDDEKEYSWVERIQTSTPGVWEDGPASGTFNACVIEPSGGRYYWWGLALPVRVTGETPFPGALVMMRLVPGSSTRYEFMPPELPPKTTDYAVLGYEDASDPTDTPTWKSAPQANTFVGRTSVVCGVPEEIDGSLFFYNLTNDKYFRILASTLTEQQVLILPATAPTSTGMVLKNGGVTTGSYSTGWDFVQASEIVGDLPATQVSYTPAVSGDWSGSAPTTVQQALDRIAAAIGPVA